MKKTKNYKMQVSTGTLILAMRDYFEARRQGRQDEMDAQLRLAEACIHDMEQEAGQTVMLVEEAEDYLDESEWDDEVQDVLVNVPKWYN